MSDDKPVNHVWACIFVGATICLFMAAWWEFSARLAQTEIVVEELVKHREEYLRAHKKTQTNQKAIIDQQEKILEKIEN